MTTKEPLQKSIEIQGPKPKKLMKSNVTDENAARAPPLDVVKGQEVLVVNGDRSNLSWKRYNLIEINQRTGMCIVEGIANGQQRNFPRSVVKPKDWIDKFKLLFRALAGVDDADEKEQKNESHHPHYVEYLNFKEAMFLLGVQYDHSPALKIFKSLDVRANGILSFGQFMNWIYGLGRVQDRGRTLTTMECVIGLRKWKNSLPYYVMQMGPEPAGGAEGGERECIWQSAHYDASRTTSETVTLITDSFSVDVPCNLPSFSVKLRDKLQSFSTKEIYSPSNEDKRECSLVVMGPGEIGKSALISKFVKGVFPHDYDPTIQDHLRKQILVDGQPALLDILDTAGQDEFGSMRYDWLKDNVDVLLICFTRADHESFVSAEELINISKRLMKQRLVPRVVPILLVGTKKDLSSAECQVTFEEVQELQERYGGSDFVSYCECSAFMDDAISDVFDSAVQLYRKWRDEKAGIEVKYPTLREVQSRNRQLSYLKQMNDTATNTKSKCISFCTIFCPATAAYLEADSAAKSVVSLSIARVPVDKFGDELAAPSYSKKQFFVRREISCKMFFVAILASIFFPFILLFQTILFTFYCQATNCCFKLLPSSADFTEPQTGFLWDFLGSIVGRDPRESSKSDDSRKWFLSQTCGQKFTRFVVTASVLALFVSAIYNALSIGIGYFGDTSDTTLSLMEYTGPVQLWFAMWLVLSFYVALDIEVFPTPPNMQSLRPHVMYLNVDESIRTTAYVFLRGFAKSTFSIFRLEANSERVISSFVIAVIWCLIPGFVRSLFEEQDGNGNGDFIPPKYIFEAISSLIVNFTFVFILILGLQMQLMSGLVKYIDWMSDITSMLDEEFADERKLHYLNLTRHNNTLAWIEMRTYLYTKGLIIFSRQEIFVLYVIGMQVATAFYTLWRLMSEVRPKDAYGSPSFDGILFMFFLLTYSLLRILRTTRMIETLQLKQIALLSSQKFQIYYKRITWHPDQNQNDLDEEEGGDQDAFDLNYDDLDIDFNALPPVGDEDYSEDSDRGDNEENKENEENDALLAKQDDDVAPIDSLQTFDAMSSAGSGGTVNNNQNKPRLVNTRTNYKGGAAFIESGESMFSAEYLEQSEKFVQSTITICEAQDIIPRVFNIKIHVAVGLSILCTTFAVIPTAARLAFGSDCGTWSD